MDISLPEFKKNNSLLVWYSDNDLKDLIIFLNKNDFYWDKEKMQYYNEELKILLKQEDLIKTIENNDFLFENIKNILKKYDRKDNYVLDDVRVAGYFMNFFIFLGIMNLFLGWIFWHAIVWILLQIVFVFLFFLFLKMRKTIIRKINIKKNAYR